MRLSELGAGAGRGRWRCAVYRTGPFLVGLRTTHAPVWDLLTALYPDTEVVSGEAIVHFRLSLRRPHGPRRWWRPQIEFLQERESPFEPYPLDHAFPLLEWGLNWCIAMRAHQYLMLHAGAVERDGDALVLPAMPGSGKSTLSAALSLRGWRLLSDEFGLYDPGARHLDPLPRAVPLKNESIGVIRAFDPRAHLGPVFPKTRKGDVAHLRPPGDSLLRQREPAVPRWILFPRFTPGSEARMEPVAKSLAFTRLAQNAFNYRLLGQVGFDALAALIRSCDCWSLVYSDLDQALAHVDALRAD